MESFDEEQQTQMEVVDTSDFDNETLLDNKSNINPLSTVSSLIKPSLLEPAEKINDKRAIKKKNVKTPRQKELEYLTKKTSAILSSPQQLNIVCERINSLLSNHKSKLITICRSIDKSHTGSLTNEQFRLILRDHLPAISTEDGFILMKLFTIDGLVDYRAIFDEQRENGLLRFVTPIPTLQPKEFLLLDRSKYITVHLRFIAFDSFNIYPGHIFVTIPDHTSVYALSKMIIDKTDLAIRFVNIFCKSVSSRYTLLEPMRSLESYSYKGTYADGRTNQLFPVYTLYYDFLPSNEQFNCSIIKHDP